MAITTVSCGPADKARIEKAAKNIIARCDWQYAGWPYAGCIRERAEAGKVICEYCEDPNRLGYNVWWGAVWKSYKVHAEEEIHLCVNNEEMALDDELLEDVMVHEWAHSCCWDHGMGIYPHNNGHAP